MKLPIISRLTAIALTACMSLGLVASEAIADVRIEYNQLNFGPLTTRALFPDINFEGPGVQQTDWYPVYLWRLASDQCAFTFDPDGPGPIEPVTIPFGDDHLLVPNVAPLTDPTGVLHNLGCPLAFDGFGIFEDESTPTQPVVPRLSKMTGNVPVYFVHSSDVEDYSGVPFNTMTWGDLKGLVADGCALEGSAELSEVLQSEAPVDPESQEQLVPGGAQVPGFKISLNGYLLNGTPFSVLAVGQNVPSNPPNIATLRTYKVEGLEYVARPIVCVD